MDGRTDRGAEGPLERMSAPPLRITRVRIPEGDPRLQER